MTPPPPTPSLLPIEPFLDEIIDVLRNNPALVLTAPTASGKTTCVPPAILKAGLAGSGLIVLLQPRRLATRAVANRMAENFKERVGQRVGYRIRFENVSGPDTRILVLTEGILTRWFLKDPLLEGVGCIILDEFHERSIHADLALSFSRELLRARNDVKLLVMSATLQLESIRAYLGHCPSIECPHTGYPINIKYLNNTSSVSLPELIYRGLLQLRSKTSGSSLAGDTLVFLPGVPEIRRTASYLAAHPLPDSPLICPLHGSLPPVEQDRILRPSSLSRIVLSTNVAETSLTVPGVRTVIDSGLAKRPVFDPRIGMDRLELIHISQGSAKQRAGRAGREAPGDVLRLWTEEEQKGRPQEDLAEIHRMDLAPVLLSILSYQSGDPLRFPFFEAPAANLISKAQSLLKILGAITPEGTHLTNLGQRLATLPVHPRMGVILYTSAQQGQLVGGALLAALLSEQELLLPTPSLPLAVASDLMYRYELFEELASGGFKAPLAHGLGINLSAAFQVQKAQTQLIRLGQQFLDPKASAATGQLDESSAAKLVLAGYPDRVCKRRQAHQPEAIMVGGRGVKMGSESGVYDAELFIALVAGAGKRGLHAVSQVHRACGIDREHLTEVFPQLLEVRHQAIFDPVLKRVKGLRRTCFLDLILEEQESDPPSPEKTADLLWEAAKSKLDELLITDESAKQLMERLRLATRWYQEQSWPGIDPVSLQMIMKDRCWGLRSFQDLKHIKWDRELELRLTSQQREILRRDFPTHMEVPSGRSMKIDYAPAATTGLPVMAVKLQELFGLADTPCIASGKLPLMLHLLAPNGRPVQMTQDLKSFWNNTYKEVRKNLRGRYPKHPWPENPWAAEATFKTKKRI